MKQKQFENAQWCLLCWHFAASLTSAAVCIYVQCLAWCPGRSPDHLIAAGHANGRVILTTLVPAFKYYALHSVRCCCWSSFVFLCVCLSVCWSQVWTVLKWLNQSRCRLWYDSGQHTHAHTRLTALFPWLPRWAGTRKVKPIWILLKQETVSGSGISWAICKSPPCSRQITMPAPHHSVFLQAGCPSCRPTNSVNALKALYVITSSITSEVQTWRHADRSKKNA